MIPPLSFSQANTAGPATAGGGTLGDINVSIGGGLISDFSKLWRRSPWAILAVVGVIVAGGVMLNSGGGPRKPGRSRKKRSS